MSDFLGRPVGRRPAEPDQARTLETLSMLLLIMLVVGALYVGREIFIPIAIAILLSFVLSPPILLLRRWGLARIPSVVLVVLAAFALIFVVSAVMTKQVSELTVDLPQYQATITAKIHDLRDAVADNALFAKVSDAMRRLGDVNSERSAPAAAAQAEEGQGAAERQRPIPVEVRHPEPGPFAILQTIAGTAMSPLETAGIVIIYVLFILLQRQDLRDRFIRLVGSGDLPRTTLAMNDAAGRLSRYFLAQTLVNSGFGLIVASGLFLIGVPGPILWGIIAFLMRFVPYIGSFIAAAFPIALAAAVAPHWGMALKTLALFMTVEAVIAYLIEPWLYGHNTGVSAVAVIISATFWTWLWGPIGLVLSTPLTVCLVVLGRHVDRLAFLDIIFGDAPPLSPVEAFYRRALVGDASEAADQAETFLKERTLVEYYDEVALPALAMADADRRRGVLDETRQKRIKDTVEEVIEDISDFLDHHARREPHAAAEESGEPGRSLAAHGAKAAHHKGQATHAPRGPAEAEAQGKVLCIAGRNDLDEAAAALFASLLERHGIKAKVAAAETLTVSRLSRLDAEEARIACLSYLDLESSGTSARFAVRRLRKRLPEAKILAAFWQGGSVRTQELCAETNADFCAWRSTEALAFCFKEIHGGAETAMFSLGAPGGPKDLVAAV